MILIVDNRDSYTFNLAQLVSTVAGTEPLVVSADDVVGSTIASRITRGEFSHVIISPGPGTPESDADFLGSRQVIEAARNIPLLGVCLGHQGLAHAAGVPLERTDPKHGMVCSVAHTGEGIFAGLPQHFQAVRYHSLHVVEESVQVVGEEASKSSSPVAAKHGRVRIHARSEDGVVQGLEILGRDHWGAQFHPESVLTEYGEQLMRNFLALAPMSDPLPAPRTTASASADETPASPAPSATPVAPQWSLAHRQVDGALDTEVLFRALRASTDPDGDVFWLDSATGDGFSVMGTMAGSLSRSYSYTRGSGETDILEQLDEELRVGVDTTGVPELPFTGGLVGYFGYECAALTMPGFEPTRTSPYADAYWMRPQSFIVYDHRKKIAHEMVLYRGTHDTDQVAETHALQARLHEAVRDAMDAAVNAASMESSPSVPKVSLSGGQWRMAQNDYFQRFDLIKEALARGDSYEVCLTDTIDYTTNATGLDLYCALRRTNPAPYAAYFSCGGVEVLSSSPERFLTVRGGTVEAKPIKGTIARSEDPKRLLECTKTRAENLMIVDLLRNDLGRVCESGTIEVPELMHVETFATVHQLVSTIRGRLKPTATLVDLIRATFPGGSMTGAPKLSTSRIIDQIETSARGVYSGALGHLGFNGSADLSIVIRTAVKQGNQVSIGAGGAIVWDSTPTSEWREKDLKVRAVTGGLV